MIFTPYEAKYLTKNRIFLGIFIKLFFEKNRNNKK